MENQGNRHNLGCTYPNKTQQPLTHGDTGTGKYMDKPKNQFNRESRIGYTKLHETQSIRGNGVTPRCTEKESEINRDILPESEELQEQSTQNNHSPPRNKNTERQNKHNGRGVNLVQNGKINQPSRGINLVQNRK